MIQSQAADVNFLLFIMLVEIGISKSIKRKKKSWIDSLYSCNLLTIAPPPLSRRGVHIATGWTRVGAVTLFFPPGIRLGKTKIITHTSLVIKTLFMKNISDRDYKNNNLSKWLQYRTKYQNRYWYIKHLTISVNVYEKRLTKTIGKLSTNK